MAGAIVVGGLVTSAALALGTAMQAAAHCKKVFWDPGEAKDDLSGNVEEIIVDLNEAVWKLGCIRKDFENKVQRNKLKAPSERYLEWVCSVVEIDEKVKEKRVEYDEESKEEAFFRSSLYVDYRVAFKKMYKKVKSLGEESNELQDKMFVDLPPKPVVYKEGPDNNFVAHEKQVNEILDLLGSSMVKKIGILGAGGIGKTAMMRNLNNHEKVAKTFDIVIWLPISKEGSRENLSREHLQQDLVRRLELNIQGSTNADEVAKRILMELQGKKYLLLLDNVKQHLNLHDIGISESNNGSKIVLTTRFGSVCRVMVEQTIKVAYLTLDKAWKMFQVVLQSPQLLENRKIQKLARQVCKECSGLPLLIEKVANTFKLKHSEIFWSDGLNSWRMWPEKECQGVMEMYKFLKLCYDDLDDDQHKKCFLYGALYPEDSVINANYLVECWAAANLLGDYDGITKKSVMYGHLILDHLKNVSLLEECENKNHVTMHKFIRQMALCIAKGDSEFKYMVETSKRLTEPPKVESWTEENRISFGDNNLKHLPDSPNCSMLSTLFVLRNSSLKIIPQSFFVHMTRILVLDISHTGIEELPSSLSVLIYLRVLYLNNCKNLVELPNHIVGKLKHLQALDIVGSGVNNIPPHIEKLAQLRRLRVSFSKSRNQNATQEVNFHYEAISKLSRLEELVIDVKSPESWSSDIVENIIKEVAQLQEFRSLKFRFSDKVVDVIEVIGSQNLRICVPDATILLTFLESSSWKSFQDIKNFEFYIGCRNSEHPQLPNFHEHVKYVNYCGMEGRNCPILKVLAEATAFELVDNINIKQLSDLELASMNGIQSCLIEGCDAIETIVGTSQSVVLPSLEHLFIKNVPKLASILAGPIQSGSLAKLATLELTGCQLLVRVFPPSAIQQLCEIKCLKIEKCDEIEEIFSDSDAHGNRPVFPKLKKMVLQDLRKLRCICATGTLEWHLEEFKVLNCPKLSIPNFA